MPLWVIIAIAGGALLVAGAIVLVVTRSRSKPAGAMRACGGCGRNMLPDWERCLFCGAKPEPSKGAVEFLCGPLVGRTIVLEAQVTAIGSGDGNEILLADPAVSRKHAGIHRSAEGYELADLGSTNGVYVNGERTAKRVLAQGDVIRVGTTEMVFRLPA